jgi:cytochrome c553
MKRLLAASAIFAAAMLVAAATPPKTHTVKLGDALHAPGYKTPVQKCGACHGKDLKGGAKASSCFKCHGQNW